VLQRPATGATGAGGIAGGAGGQGAISADSASWLAAATSSNAGGGASDVVGTAVATGATGAAANTIPLADESAALVPVGAATWTMLPHLGQAMIWPMSDALRTESRARHVTQVILKGSTRGSIQPSAFSGQPE
jgi:hypothetical protein